MFLMKSPLLQRDYAPNYKYSEIYAAVTHTHTHTRTHTRTNTHTHTQTHAHALSHTHARARTHAHTYSLSHTHTHTHTHDLIFTIKTIIFLLMVIKRGFSTFDKKYRQNI